MRAFGNARVCGVTRVHAGSWAGLMVWRLGLCLGLGSYGWGRGTGLGLSWGLEIGGIGSGDGLNGRSPENLRIPVFLYAIS